MIFPILFMLSISSLVRTSAFAPARTLSQNILRKGILNMSSKVRVTTYNVLSSSLGGADYFTSCKPEHLDGSYRLKELIKKLDVEIENKAIICLQEVSTPWAGALHVYFANKGYHMVTGLYGKKFDGYMGVVTAVPTSVYDILNVDITRVGETKKTKRSPKPSFMERFVEIIKEPFFSFLKLLKLCGLNLIKEQPVNPWNEAVRRFNQMVSVRLQAKDGGKPFVVGTYHMPCMFRVPAVMMIHCALCTQHLQKFSTQDPCLLVGDFNIKPGSSMYRMITEGEIEATNPEYPPIVEGDDWRPKVQPMNSAYKVALGQEPEWTNWSKIREEEPFVDTLDYIFMSKKWTVDSVSALPSKTEIVGPLPLEHEPSDHLLLSATVSFE